MRPKSPAKTDSDPERYYLRLEADWGRPPEKKPAEDEGPRDETVTTGTPPEEKKLEAKRVNDRLSPWTYEISKWQYDALATEPDALMEAVDEAEEPEKTESR